ncbi:MAG: YebC/PmpR family DNA-binding transcriptional regulator [Candidatus Paceibacterota bacterium]|jgi:YebC/PmpR family DNA-binding regulatory protein
MSGHNKWSKIKRKKEVTDAKKSKIFSKVVRLITVESKITGGNINSPGLKTAIEKAKEVNMPADNIERAIKKGSEPSVQMESITYEAYGHGGVGLIIDVLTDNRNKSAQEVKHILSKNNCSLAGIGAVTWSFKKEGAEWIPTTTIPISDEDGEKLEKLIDDLEENDDVQEVYTNAE